MNKWTAVACVLSTVASTQVHAATARWETTEIRLRYDRAELTSPAAARHLLRRIQKAALESCGASSFSLNEIKTSTAASRCWRDAVDNAVRSVDEPLLTEAASESRR